MAIDQKRKGACQRAITEHIARHGAGSWDHLLREFEDIPPATFWRWVRAAKGPATAQEAPAAPALPAVPGVGDLRGAAIDPQAVLSECLRHAQEVIAYSRGTDGRLRSPKLLLAASRAMGEVLKTAAAVSATLLDESRTRDFYRAIWAELEAESPAFRARVAARLEAVNADLGLRSYVGG